MRVVELPVSATEDRVVGTLDIEHAIKHGEKKFEAGILAQANRNILYVDEINLLDDHVVDVLLDAAAMGINTVEREGVSYSHPARFVLVGTMNPEEGDIRPQLLDRFGLSVVVTGEHDPAQRVEVIKRRLAYEQDADTFIAGYQHDQEELAAKITQASSLLPQVDINEELLETVAKLAVELGVDGHRADITVIKTALTLAAFNGRKEVELEEKALAKQAKKQEKLELKEEARQKRAAKRREWKKRTKEVFSGWKESIREKLPKKKQEPPEILENTKTSTAADPMGDTETSEQTEQTDAVEMTVTEEEQTEKSVDTEGSGTTSMEEA